MSGCATRRTPGANGAVHNYCKTHHSTRSPNGASNGSAALTHPPTSASQSWRARSLAQVKLDPAENVPLLAPLLDMPPPQERVPTLAPEELRRRQLAALTAWMMAGARVQPAVLAFEDLHWADPTTLDLLRGIAERGALAPLFVVATTRPEFRPPWGTRSHHSTISLAPLDRAQVRDMVAELSARHALPRDVVEDVAARIGGVPLFVEEVTRLLLERGEQGGIQYRAIVATIRRWRPGLADRLASRDPRGAIVLGWSGMRGLITLATAFALPQQFPGRDLIVLCAFCMVLGTLVIQGCTLRPLMRLLRFEDDGGVERELSRARRRHAGGARQPRPCRSGYGTSPCACSTRSRPLRSCRH